MRKKYFTDEERLAAKRAKNQRALAKAKLDPEFSVRQKAYMLAWRARSENHAKIIEYGKRSHAKAKSKPGYHERRRATCKRWIAKIENYRKKKEYLSRPEVKERCRANTRRCNAKPEAKLKRRKYRLSYYQRRINIERAKLRLARKNSPAKQKEYDRRKSAKRRAGGGCLSKGIEFVLLKQQRSLCNACKCDISAGYQLDHIVALARGGRNVDLNIQLLCKTCNNRKWANDFDTFLKQLKEERNERAHA